MRSLRVAASDGHLDDVFELSHEIRDVGSNLIAGHVEEVTSGDIVLADIEGVESTGEEPVLGQELLEDSSCAAGSTWAHTLGR